MNKKQRIAAALLVISVIVLFFAFTIEYSISDARESYDYSDSRGSAQTKVASVGSINLEIIPRLDGGGEHYGVG